MASMPKDWEQGLTRQLDELDRLHAQLREGCEGIRAAVATRDNPAVLAGVKGLQRLMAELRAAERAAAGELRAWGLLGPAEPFLLARLGQRPPIAAHPELGARLQRSLALAAAAGRAAAINRRLIERLSAWLQREMVILLEPFTEPAGYGATGAQRPGASRAAVVDQRG